MTEQIKNEYSQCVNSFICTLREWLIYCIFRVPSEILDLVYEALITCIFDGTDMYKRLQAAMEVQPCDWAEIERIMSSRYKFNASRSAISVSAEVCLCSLSSFMPFIPSLSLDRVSCDFASSLCKTHPHVSLIFGNSRILTFVEDQSTWGAVWLVVRDTTGIRVWSALSTSDCEDAAAPPVASQVSAQTSAANSATVRDGDESASVSASSAPSACPDVPKKIDSKDQGDAESSFGDPSSPRDHACAAANDDESMGGPHLLNDEDFIRVSGKLAVFQSNPHTGRVEILKHLLDYLNESIAPSSVALDGSRSGSTRLIQTREEARVKLSVRLQEMLHEEIALAAERRSSTSTLFPPSRPPPVAHKRLWQLQFTRQLLSSFMFVSPFTATMGARMLSAADEVKAIELFDKIPTRDNLTVMLALPPAGSSPDADEFLNSLQVNATQISDSEFFLSTPDRDIRFVVSCDLPPLPEGRWTSPAHVQVLWQPQDAGCFDPSTSIIPDSCHCVVLQPIGAHLIRVENVLVSDGDRHSSAKSCKVPFLRGSIVNVNVIEPIVLATAIFLTDVSDVNRYMLSFGHCVPSLSKRRFDVLSQCFAWQKAEGPQSFFDAAATIHSQ
jgi:hypothetical protein